MSSLKEQGDLFWTLTHQDTQSGIIDKNWSSQEWKSDELIGRPVYEKTRFVHTAHGQIYC